MALTNLAPPVNYNVTPVDLSPITGAAMAYAQGQKRQEQQAQRQEIVSQAQELFRAGDMDAIGEFAIANPELGRTMFEMGGIRDEAAQKRMTGLSKQLAMSSFPVRDLKAHIAQGEAAGRDMTHSKNLLADSGGDPAQLKKISEMGWASNDPKTYKYYRSSLPAEEKPMTAYQAATIEGKKADQALRKEEAAIRRDSNRLKRETDELKREELKNKIETSKQKVEAANRAKTEKVRTAINASESLISNIDQLAGNKEYIDSLTGYRGRSPVSLTDAGVEAEALLENVTNSLTLDNLKLMSGTLTDKDIDLLKSAASGLQKGMSVDRFQEVLGTIKNKVKTGMDSKKKANPELGATQQTLSDKDLLKKYGG